MEQVHSFWRTTHKPLTDLVERYHVKRLVVAGNKSLLPEFVKSLPQRLNSNIISQVNMDAFTSPADAVRRIFPEIEAWERKREQGIVSELLDFAGVSSKAAVGLEPTLKYIQDGRAARLIIAKDFDREIQQCLKCEYVSANSNHSCRHCSATEVRQSALAEALPRLVVRYGVPVEIVKGPAAVELTKSGGVGVFLRF
jgi:ribosomal protein L7Ae-like RNA K-turn-binding protein